MQVYLIRHGKTLANEQWRYCGQTNTALSENGVAELTALKAQGGYPPSVELFFTSGMRRADQTLELIYGKVSRTHIPEIAEYNFGLFEMKSHDELKDMEDYNAWIDDETGGVECPSGESKNHFKLRVLDGYARILSDIQRSRSASALIVCHGGTIARVMESLQPDTKDFYGWQPRPGRGYVLIYAEGRFHKYKNL